MKGGYQRHAAGRMFENEFLETCSKIHPIVPLVVYGPVVVGLLGYGFSKGLTTPLATAVWGPLGVLTWLLMEYVLHRFLFHWEGNGPFTRRFHAIIHGYHHQFPDDTTRLVMPLGASIPLALLIGGGLYLAGSPAQTLPYFCGIVVGYLAYDYMHWAVHAVTPKTTWGKAMRSHHMAHHFAVPEKNFGISNRWIDALVGTLKRRPQA